MDNLNQDLVNKLIAHYEMAIKKVKKKWFFKRALNVCYDLNVDCGVCNAAIHIFDEYIYETKFVKQNCSINKHYWYDLPQNCLTKKQILNCLEHRVKILKTFKE